MSDKYKHTWKSYLVDHHSPDIPSVPLNRFDPDEYERFYLTAGIDSLLVYCKDHWGTCYYDTKIGKKHTGVKTDWVARISNILRKHDYEFVAYYSVEYDNYAAATHPEWRAVTDTGNPLRRDDPYGKWWVCCYETDYRRYVLQQLEEIVGGYHPDSLFLDIAGPSLCYCYSCRSQFREQNGYELPSPTDLSMSKKLDVFRFLQGRIKRFLTEVRNRVKAIDPSLALTINFSNHYSADIQQLTDYQSSEPWCGNWISGAYTRNLSTSGYVQLGPGEESRIYDYKHPNYYILDAAEISARNCKMNKYSGSQHPDGTLEFKEAELIGAGYRELSAYQDFLLDREPIADLWILHSEVSELIGTDGVIPDSILRMKKGNSHKEAIRGAMELLDYTKVSWKIIEEEHLPALLSERCFAELPAALIAPEIYSIDDETLSAIKRFVEGGGTLFVDGLSGLYTRKGVFRGPDSSASAALIQELTGTQYIDENRAFYGNEWGSYLRFTDVMDALYPFSLNGTPPTSNVWYRFRKTAGTVVAYHTEPAVAVTDDQWVNWWSPPPSRNTEWPAIILHRIGKGNVLFFSFPYFRMNIADFTWSRSFFSELVRATVNHKRIRLRAETEYRENIAVSYYQRPRRKEIIIHVLNSLLRSTGGKTISLPAGELFLSNSWKRYKEASLVYPEKRPLSIQHHGEQSIIVLPPCDLHYIIRIAYENRE